MKKILILLMLCYSFLFSADITSGLGSCPNVYVKSNGWVLYKNKGQSLTPFILNFGGLKGKTYLDNFRLFYSNGNFCYEYTYQGNVQPDPLSPDTYIIYDVKREKYSYTSVSPCSSGLEFNYNTLTCGAPQPTCDSSTQVDIDGVCENIGEQGSCVSPNIRLSTGECTTCTPDQHWNLNLETCVNNCNPVTVQNPKPSEWINLNKTNGDICTSFLIDRQIDGSFLSQDDGCGGVSSGCFGQADSPCDDILSPSLQRPRGGYIYKGRVPNSSVCSSYVDGYKYIDSRIRQVDDNCVKNDDYYCYLLPLNTDNNETNQDNPLPNSNPDGTVPNDNNISSNLPINNDNNLSNPQKLNNQILQDLKNNLQNQNDDINAHNSWFKNKFGKWEPSDFQTNMDDTNNLLKAIKDKPVADIDVNLDTKPITDKLQELIDKNSSVDLSPLLENNPNDYDDSNGSAYVLSDINNSINTSSLDDFIGTFTTAWSNMETDISTVSTDGNSLIETLKTDRDGGFTLNLPRATVTECPYIGTIDFSSIKANWILPISVDFCKPFSKSYPVFYILFSIVFTVFIIGFGFKSLMRLV